MGGFSLGKKTGKKKARLYAKRLLAVPLFRRRQWGFQAAFGFGIAVSGCFGIWNGGKTAGGGPEKF